MKHYFIYLKARWTYRKEIRHMIKDFLLRNGSLMENKVKKLIKSDFTKSINHKMKTKLTEQDMIDYLECSKFDIDKIIKEKIEKV